jgi:general secretion pathway protein G
LGHKKGFTLIELLVVMVILVMLAGVVTALVTKRVEEARHAKAVYDIEELRNALDQYFLPNGKYPSSDEGLDALREKPQGDDLPNWNGPYTKKPVPNDPWGRPYIYVSPGEHDSDAYDLYSLGRDGKEGGSGSDADITSWE